MVPHGAIGYEKHSDGIKSLRKMRAGPVFAPDRCWWQATTRTSHRVSTFAILLTLRSSVRGQCFACVGSGISPISSSRSVPRIRPVSKQPMRLSAAGLCERSRRSVPENFPLVHQTTSWNRLTTWIATNGPHPPAPAKLNAPFALQFLSGTVSPPSP